MDRVTAHVASRVREQRKATRLSGPALATEMNARGIPWNRTTVAKLETGRRESVTASELMALAAVLQLPVTALLPIEACPVCVDDPPAGFTCNTCGRRR